ncbi:MAG: hypothetical protein KDA24_03145 [Deltaproteobacteria bacterium]|nr:hypothetical protein [Deltaproteobacteria bacterium]
MRSALSLLVVAAGLFLAAPAAHADAPDPLDPAVQYGVCVSCHGAHGEGRPALDGPRIGDLDSGYIQSQLEAYRDGTRGSHPDDVDARSMVAIAKGLPDGVIATLAPYVAALSPQPLPPGEPIEGAELEYQPCGACHGADAAGVPGVGPALLHLPTDTLVTQLGKYQEGLRGGANDLPAARLMAAMAQVDDATVARIAGHIASLRPPLPPLDSPPPKGSRDSGLKAFADIYAVSTHPRCMNCHPDGDAPLQTDDSIPHVLGITRFSPMGGTHCRQCHSAFPAGDGLAPMPPADPNWSMPPRAMAFENRTPAQLCAQLKDPTVNGGRGLNDLTRHAEEDHLLQTSWHSGRAAPPITHEELVQRFATWADAGGPCPEETEQ